MKSHTLRRRDVSEGSCVAVEHLVSIIDDDESMRLALVGLIRSLGYEARGFASAHEFLDGGQESSVSCLIVDIQLPGMTGIELMELLRSKKNRVPVIVITARNEPGLEERAAASGAIGYLKKPFPPQTLVDCIETALHA
jgi:FixJ family two-component response regulator